MWGWWPCPCSAGPALGATPSGPLGGAGTTASGSFALCPLPDADFFPILPYPRCLACNPKDAPSELSSQLVPGGYWYWTQFRKIDPQQWFTAGQTGVSQRMQKRLVRPSWLIWEPALGTRPRIGPSQC